MVADFAERIVHIQGDAPYDIGVALGRHLKARLEHNIQRYITQRPDPYVQMNLNRFRSQALPWLEQLPLRFRDECAGMANGCGLSLQRIAEWAYIEAYILSAHRGSLMRANPCFWRYNPGHCPKPPHC
ncbi:hypothetical protein IH992_22035 [Candidatus Poribacteria bacterium]|nr:hypothetical protein [Candidatus Poribacteria bacterium]